MYLFYVFYACSCCTASTIPKQHNQRKKECIFIWFTSNWINNNNQKWMRSNRFDFSGLIHTAHMPIVILIKFDDRPTNMPNIKLNMFPNGLFRNRKWNEWNNKLTAKYFHTQRDERKKIGLICYDIHFWLKHIETNPALILVR